MVKLTLTTVLGLATLGWAFVAADTLLTPTPPTIRAEPGPIKQRPADYAARHDQAPAARNSQRPAPAPIDINLILPR